MCHEVGALDGGGAAGQAAGQAGQAGKGAVQVATVFSGIHNSTLASLVLARSGFNDAAASKLNVEDLKAQLARVALPLPMMKSEQLSRYGPDYFTDHSR